MAENYARGHDGDWQKFTEEQLTKEVKSLKRSLGIWQLFTMALLAATLVLGFIIHKVDKVVDDPIQVWLPRVLKGEAQ